MLSFVLKLLMWCTILERSNDFAVSHVNPKKGIIISSAVKILHISVIQCQLILMKHLSSFLRMIILIYSILTWDIAFLAFYGFTPPR